MKKNVHTPLADEYLQSLQEIREVETDPFFYTRLKARMEKQLPDTDRGFTFKPAWVVSILMIFLFINTFFLVTQLKNGKDKTVENTTENTTLQNFASGYDLTVSTSF